MVLPDLRKLIVAYTRARSEGNDDRALTLLEKLVSAQPDEPRWLKRQAEIFCRLGQTRAELEALRGAFERQLHSEQTTRAIATARRILELDPADLATEEQLDLLHMASGHELRNAGSEAAPNRTVPGTPRASRRDEIVLTEVIRGAHTVALDDTGEASVAEIPIDKHEPGWTVEEDEPSDPDTSDPGGPLDRTIRDEQALRAKLLKQLSQTELERLLENSTTRSLAPGELCVRQGEAADCMFVVLDGALLPVVENPEADPSEIELGTLEAGDFCGEIGLLASQPRNASIKAIVPSRVLRIDRGRVRKVLRGHPETLQLVLRTLRLRLIDRLIRTHPIFACFEHSVRARVAAQFKLVEVGDGSVVIQEGMSDPGLFVVLAGEVEVHQSSHSEDKVLARVDHGGILGELSALYGQPAVASATARSQCWLLHLSVGRFAKILECNPRVQAMLSEIAAARTRENRSLYDGSE